MAEAAARCGEFMVRSSFTITGRGTCVAGYVVSGNFRCDDDVRWVDGEHTRRAKCSGLSTITERPIKYPPTVGLMVTNAEPSDFVEGMTLIIYR